MKQLTQNQLTLLHSLGDGVPHSGNELGKALGITRSAIWKQINQLIEAGIPVNRLPQQGYQLPEKLILLNDHAIANHLASLKFSIPYKLHLYHFIDSTNRYLKELPGSTGLDICCAELQTQGRGRFGRIWHAPFGENLCCSTRWNFNGDLTRLSGLSLVTSLAVLATIQEQIPSPEIKVKWPNDILWGDKKLCGSLIEIMAESNGSAQVIIGIGLNINTDTENNPLPDKKWASLFELSGQKFDRNLIAASLIKNLELWLSQFLMNGLAIFTDQWNQNDYLAGKEITVTQGADTIRGIAKGINHLGHLILKDDQGKEHLLSSGDTSLRTEGTS